jgi:hypothetical protein
MNSHKSAIFSPCRTWRYALERIWWPMDKHVVAFIGLNPSTADETQDDPTVRRCLGYAKKWGYGSMVMLNIFAFRATDPRVMKAAADPMGPDNNAWITTVANRADLVVAAWGNDGVYRGRSREVVDLLHQAGIELMCLRLTKQGEPWHPLYLPKNLQPIHLSPKSH